MSGISRNFYLLVYIMAISGAVAASGLIDSDLTVFVFVVCGWIVSVILHEFGHAKAAEWQGDTSARAAGYMSLDPMRFVDPVNSIAIPVLFLILGGIGLPGAAVYLDFSRMRSPMGRALVSAAGPAANLVVLMVLALPFALGLADTHGTVLLWSAIALLAFFQATAIIFNLLPVPGFDGFGIVSAFLPDHLAERARQWGLIAFLILFALIMTVPAVGQLLTGLSLRLVYAFGIDPAWIVAGLRKFQFWRSLR